MSATKKIRVLHVTSSLAIGGAEKVLYEIISGLNSHEFEHHVAYVHDGPYKEMLHALDIKTYAIEGYVWKTDLVAIYHLYRVIKLVNPDVMHTLLWFANTVGFLLGRLLHIPCVSVFHNNIDQNGIIRNSIDRITIRYADRLVAVSQEVALSVASYHTNLSSPIAIINNGVSSNSDTTNNVNKIRQKDRFTIGAVGRLHAIKNYSLLLRAVYLLDDSVKNNIQVLIVGDGSEKGKLQSYARKLKIDEQVVFCGMQDAQAYYPFFDCFVMTSDKEGISMALLEAMSYGIVPVVTNYAKTHSVITNHYNGILVPSGDAKALSLALLCLYFDYTHMDQSLINKLKNHAQLTIKNRFRKVDMIEKYKEQFLRSDRAGRCKE
jgi:glycosyltransferase involved in cell wall biosynthesis